MLHTLQRSQLIKTDLDTAWHFISSPKNLAIITPKYMGIEIISELNDEKMYAGQIIEYYVRPVLNIKLHWVTEITQLEEKVFFIDEQRFGPYSFWHHKHYLKETEQGVEMTDLVHYKLPLFFLGDLAHSLFVKKQLTQVFDHRFQTIENLFNKV